ncbi:DUF6602 domain-containing protein [Nocardia carnea]|uniref:DUF6602 domain-containing protein n=1 Tax=Nocardia carnea TaxID=37328 RepID=UPI0024570B50|nr:DUF6602 domain-containing protein [Nocardia carnea]
MLPSDPYRSRFDKVMRVWERQLELALERARESLEHRGDRGASVEDEVRETLRRFLPRQYDVGHGAVYDAFGDGSRQLDVIIANSKHPISYPKDERGPYLLDGVSAVGEVKSVLTTAELERSIQSAIQFKKLRPTPVKGEHITNHEMEYIRETQGIPPYFIILHHRF